MGTKHTFEMVRQTIPASIMWSQTHFTVPLPVLHVDENGDDRSHRHEDATNGKGIQANWFSQVKSGECCRGDEHESNIWNTYTVTQVVRDSVVASRSSAYRTNGHSRQGLWICNL